MRILDFRVTNYKSYRDTGRTELGRDFTVVVGRNNVGKTALVEGIGLRLSNHPHRSLGALPTPDTRPQPASEVRLTLAVSQDELLSALDQSRAQGALFVPFQPVADPHREAGDAAQRFADAVQAESIVRVSWRGGPGGEHRPVAFLEKYPELTGQTSFFTMGVDRGRRSVVRSDQGVYGGTDLDRSYPRVLADALLSRIYTFQAERPAVGRSPVGASAVLLPNAANLPEVLASLQRDPGRFARLNRLLHEILPDIWAVAVYPSQEHPSSLEILVYTFDPSKTWRPDLAMRLTDCGTGVSQVLAILYVALYSDVPLIIIIDEPQSFLHPGATRSLLELLKTEAPQHQYVLTTHSPTAVTAVRADRILLVRLENGESKLQVVEGEVAQEAELLLAEVGARFADVFGADRILWVEGETEEVCLPRILSRAGGNRLHGTKILAVRQTGDLGGKLAKATIEIYQRLVRAGAVLPPVVGFLFDRETRSASEQQDISRRVGTSIYFTHTRMFENYLLDVSAMSSVLSTITQTWECPVSGTMVEEWLKANLWRPDFFAPQPVPADRSNASWQRDVHGKAVLTAVFRELSGARLQYDPIRHGLALTERLLDTDPAAFTQLADLVEAIIATSN